MKTYRLRLAPILLLFSIMPFVLAARDGGLLGGKQENREQQRGQRIRSLMDRERAAEPSSPTDRAPSESDDSTETEPGRLEWVARTGVEKILSAVLETAVSVGQAKLDREGQLLELQDVKIANPDGFQADNVMTFKTIHVEAEPRSLFSREPAVRLVRVDGASVNVESSLTGGLNLKKLQDAAMRFKGPKLLDELPKKEKMWRIDKAVLESCDVELNMNPLERKPLKKTVGPIEMQFLGPGGKGEQTNTIVSQFLSRFMKELGVL